MKKKIVFVVNSLRGGGAERVVSTLCSYLSKNTFEVTIICLNTEPHSYAIDEDVKIVQLVERPKAESIYSRIKSVYYTFIRLLLTLKKERPECAVSFMTTPNLWTGITCGLLRIPYFVSERTTPDASIHQLGNLLKWISFNVYRNSKAIIIPSRGIEDCFRKNKMFDKLKNYQTIQNPVTKFKTNANTEVYPYRFILAAGRLLNVKGFDLLIEAFSMLADKEIHLLISGEGPDREKLQKQINSFELEYRVKLIGFRSNIQDYYKQAEMFVLSSRYEGYPNALVEAMSFGCPVISTNCEFGPSEIVVDGKNGLLVKANSTKALAQGMSRLLDDPVLKFQIAQRALQINETNSLDAISSKWENLILSHV